MHLTLKPHMKEIMRLPHYKRLLATKGLNLLITLMPAAIPSTRYLRSFRSVSRQAPCYPSSLVDSEQLAPINAQWDAFNGAALCSVAFRDRILVSTRNKGLPRGMDEFNTQGRHLGKATDKMNSVGTVVVLAAGRSHVACCGNAGTIMILSESVGGSTTAATAGAAKHCTWKDGIGYEPEAPLTPAAEFNSGGQRQTEFTAEDPTAWAPPMFIPAHAGVCITAACMLSHAGVDFLFTADKKSILCLTMLDRGECVKTVRSPQFFQAAVTGA